LRAVVLAGGRGRRFKPYTDLVPKPMVPVGRLEKPILEYIVAWLYRLGLRDFLFLVGYRWRQVFNYFGDGSRFGVRIEYSVDRPPYSGTGGALLQAARAGLLGDSTVLVWYGDILAPLDVRGLLGAHRAAGASVTLAVAARYRVMVGVVEEDGGRVVRVREKPWLPLRVVVGVFALEPRAVLEAGEELGPSFDLVGDMVPLLLERGEPVAAYTHEGPWYDVGSLERYQKLPEEELAEFLETPWP